MRKLYRKPTIEKDPKYPGLTQPFSMAILTNLNRAKILEGDPHGDISDVFVACSNIAGD
jgi:hypothetical protein